MVRVIKTRLCKKMLTGRLKISWQTFGLSLTQSVALFLVDVKVSSSGWWFIRMNFNPKCLFKVVSWRLTHANVGSSKPRCLPNRTKIVEDNARILVFYRFFQSADIWTWSPSSELGPICAWPCRWHALWICEQHLPKHVFFAWQQSVQYTNDSPSAWNIWRLLMDLQSQENLQTVVAKSWPKSAYSLGFEWIGNFPKGA